MRKPTRAFVVTFAAALSGAPLGCGGSSASSASNTTTTQPEVAPLPANPPSQDPPVVLRNPPPPDPPPSATTDACPPRETIQEGAVCTTTAGVRCYEHPGCGLNGFECREGHWRAMHTFCNPPRR